MQRLPFQGNLELLRGIFDTELWPLMRWGEPWYGTLPLWDNIPPAYLTEVEGLGRTYVKGLVTYTAPGHAVHTHTDRLRPPRYSRWHLPLWTEGTVLIEDGVEHIMLEGNWYGPVKYWLPHSVAANTRKRVHFIVDTTE